MYLDLFFFIEKHFLLSLCIAFGNETHNEHYFLCLFIILSITWALLTGLSPSSVWTDGSQQPSLQSGAEGCQCRKATAAAPHTCTLHSHSYTFTQTAVHEGVGAASSARFMHSQCYDFPKDPFLLNVLDWKRADLCGNCIISISFNFSSSISPECRDWHFWKGSPTHSSL